MKTIESHERKGEEMKNRYAMFSLLVATASLLLSGCGGSKTEESAAKDQEGTTVQTGEAAASNPADKLHDGRVSELKVVFPGGSSSPEDLEAVEEQMNQIVSKYMDATVDLQILEWGVFPDQQNLMLSSGEDIALMFTFSSSKNYATSNQVMDITDLCEDYAGEALKLFSKYAEACKIDGKYYGLPTFHEYTKASGLICRSDILKELNIDPDSVKTWGDIGDVLAKVKEAHPEMNPLVPVEVNAGILDYYNEGKFDLLMETAGIGIRMDDKDATVLNIYDTPEFMELANQAYEWNQKGYFMADATTVTDTRQDLLAAGSAFGYIGQIHPGTATQELKNSGVAVTTIPVSDKALTTGNVNFAQYMVPTACSAPEKAVKLLDLLLTDKDMANLFLYGIEGKDYVVKDEQEDIIGYPDGIDSSNVGWNNEVWLAGNGSLAHVWESDAPDIWEQYQKFNDSAAVSPAYGFTYDPQNVKSEITAISNVIKKYEAVICAGYSEPEKSVNEMVSELKAAGIEKVVADAQSQVDAWKAENQ